MSPSTHGPSEGIASVAVADLGTRTEATAVHGRPMWPEAENSRSEATTLPPPTPHEARSVHGDRGGLSATPGQGTLSASPGQALRRDRVARCASEGCGNRCPGRSV